MEWIGAGKILNYKILISIVKQFFQKVKITNSSRLKLSKRCSYSELFWSAFSRIRTEYAEIRSIFPYSVQMRENADQNNSEYGHFLRSLRLKETTVSSFPYEIFSGKT